MEIFLKKKEYAEKMFVWKNSFGWKKMTEIKLDEKKLDYNNKMNLKKVTPFLHLHPHPLLHIDSTTSILTSQV